MRVHTKTKSIHARALASSDPNWFVVIFDNGTRLELFNYVQERIAALFSEKPVVVGVVQGMTSITVPHEISTSGIYSQGTDPMQNHRLVNPRHRESTLCVVCKNLGEKHHLVHD